MRRIANVLVFFRVVFSKSQCFYFSAFRKKCPVNVVQELDTNDKINLAKPTLFSESQVGIGAVASPEISGWSALPLS